MEKKIKSTLKNLADNPKMQKVLQSIKPEKSVWGVLGVIVFFITPEIIAFIWGSDIAVYAKVSLGGAASMMERQYYEMLIMVFEEGGSWINLALGGALMVWLFF